jgi:protein required for attachment to host cells
MNFAPGIRLSAPPEYAACGACLRASACGRQSSSKSAITFSGPVRGGLKVIRGSKEACHASPLPRIWIMAVDSRIAKIFRKTDQGLEYIGEAVSAETADPATAAEETGVKSFVGKVGDWLDRAVTEDAFDRLVLVANAQVLAEIRKVLTRQVHMRIVAEVSRTLTSLDVPSLRQELKKIVWF